MKRKNVFNKLCVVSLSLVLALILMPNNVKAEELETQENHSVGTHEFNILDDGNQTQTIETNEGTWTFTIKNLDSETPSIAPRYSQNWGTGTFNKRVSANFEGSDGGGNSFLAKMSARFTGSINPYVARITGVSDGDFNATLIVPINQTEKYEILASSATPSEYAAEARFRQKYTISTPFGQYGQHDMCLYLQVQPNGTAHIFMQGIW